MPSITTFFPRHALVTPDDNTDIPGNGEGVVIVYNSDGGTIAVEDKYGGTDPYPVVGNEFVVPCQVRKVLATGSSGITETASRIMAHW